MNNEPHLSASGWEKRMAMAFIGLWTLITMGLVVFRRINFDEFAFVHAAWLVGQGKEPRVDFFDHHHATLYELLAPPIGLVGERVESFMVARVLLFIFTVGGICVFWRLGARLMGRRIALWAIPIWMSMRFFHDDGIEVRPDLPMTALALFALERLFHYREVKSGKTLLASGFLFFLAFAFLQKAIFLFLPAAGLVIWNVFKKRMTPGHGALFFSGALLPTLFVAALLVTGGGWERYWIANWQSNLGMVSSRFDGGELFSKSFRDDFPAWVFGAIGIALALKERGNDPWQKGLAILALFHFSLVFFTTVGTGQYYLLTLPMVAVFAARALVPHTRPRQLALAMTLLVPLVGLFARWPQGHARQAAVIAFVEEMVPTGECLFDGRKTFNVFRADCEYFWLGHDPLPPDLARKMDPRWGDAPTVKSVRPALIPDWMVEPADPWFGRHYRPHHRTFHRDQMTYQFWVRRDLKVPGENSVAGSELRGLQE
jgi:hypothetical protein